MLRGPDLVFVARDSTENLSLCSACLVFTTFVKLPNKGSVAFRRFLFSKGGRVRRLPQCGVLFGRRSALVKIRKAVSAEVVEKRKADAKA